MSKILKKTKIVATVGPACNTKPKLKELIEAGANVFRLNFSHGTHEDHLKVIKNIRELNKEHGFNATILQDLQGPKIRIGEVEKGSVTLEMGKELKITSKAMVGTSKMVSTTYPDLPKDVKVGDRILMDDGKIILEAISAEADTLTTKVIFGGELKSKKGINLPFTNISSPSLTEKDSEDLIFGLEHEVDWIALSFVRNHIDILLLKHLIRQKSKRCRVVAKIEKPEAIQNLEEIVNATDAIMVARGDLGVEIGMEAVPMEQKRMVRLATQASKPVIIATQMMESMITNPGPTRAETNDVANAVLDGADALMLSAETAVGKFPKLVIESMTKTIQIAEATSQEIYHKNFDLDKDSKTFDHDSVIAASNYLLEDIGAKAIIGMTSSGYTAFRVAMHRPKADIFIFTSRRSLVTQLNLLWGVKAFFYDKFESTDATFEDVNNLLKEEGLLEVGDKVINLASMPLEKKKRTNVIKLSTIE